MPYNIPRIAGVWYNWIPGCSEDCREVYELSMLAKPRFYKSFFAWISWLWTKESEISVIKRVSASPGEDK